MFKGFIIQYKCTNVASYIIQTYFPMSNTGGAYNSLIGRILQHMVLRPDLMIDLRLLITKNILNLYNLNGLLSGHCKYFFQ